MSLCTSEFLLIVELLSIVAGYDMHETYAVVVINLYICSTLVMVHCCIFMCAMLFSY